MKLTYILTFITLLFIFQTERINSNQISDEQLMKTLVYDIIDNPSSMFRIMEKTKTIDCTDLIDLLKKEEWILINFTIDLTRIFCLNYEYIGVEVYKTSNPNQDIYHYQYVINEGDDNEDYIIFRFDKEGKKITFKGIEETID